MIQPSVTLGYHTFVGEYKLGDEITTFSIPALKEHDNGVRDKVLDKFLKEMRAEMSAPFEYLDWDSIEAVYIRLRQQGKQEQG